MKLSQTKKIIALVTDLPILQVENLKILGIPMHSLKVDLSRLEKRGDLIRLKKGLYTSKRFVDKAKANNTFSNFLEFLAVKIYPRSYLSLEYVL